MLPVAISVIRWLGLPGCAIIAMLGFYEGVPIVKDVTPLIRWVPVVGTNIDWIAQGRVGRAYEGGKRDADLEWQHKQIVADAKKQAAENAKQGKLDKIATDFTKSQIDIATQLLDVAHASQENADAGNKKRSGNACRVAFPRRVSDSLNRVGRPSRSH